MDAARVLAVLHALSSHGVHYKVVGGVALNLHGIARATEDLDIFVDPTSDNVERLKTALKSVYADAHIDEITVADLAGEYPTIQYVPPEGTFSIDILARLGTAFDYAGIEATSRTVEGVAVAVATPRMLYRMKRDTVRPQDHADAARLQQVFGPLDD